MDHQDQMKLAHCCSLWLDTPSNAAAVSHSPSNQTHILILSKHMYSILLNLLLRDDLIFIIKAENLCGLGSESVTKYRSSLWII